MSFSRKGCRAPASGQMCVRLFRSRRPDGEPPQTGVPNAADIEPVGASAPVEPSHRGKEEPGGRRRDGRRRAEARRDESLAGDEWEFEEGARSPRAARSSLPRHPGGFEGFLLRPEGRDPRDLSVDDRLEGGQGAIYGNAAAFAAPGLPSNSQYGPGAKVGQSLRLPPIVLDRSGIASKELGDGLRTIERRRHSIPPVRVTSATT